MKNSKHHRAVVRSLGLAAFAILTGAAHARGVSPYLPLAQSPEIERQIERVLILADQPILRRPIAAATVFDALPKACERDAVLCEQVKRYLATFMQTFGVTHASLAVGVDSGTTTAIPNRHGMSTESSYEASATAYWQPGDYLVVSGGVVAYRGDSTPTGSMVSIGSEYAQVDIGYRDHWLSPFTDSAMLLSTNATTMPSITISNYAPITRWGFRYEAFVAQMSDSDRIFADGVLMSGNPRLAGVQLSIEPFPGWALGVNRVLQFGGGDRPESFGDLVRAFVDPASDNTGSTGDPADEFGNQVASFTSRFLMQTPIPVAVYLEYAGEDTSTTSNVRLGNAALSIGVELPVLWEKFDLTVEVSEWQNAWYEHHIYLDGLRNDGRVIGHWGGDLRAPGDDVGARSWTVRLGWRMNDGASLDATVRTLTNQSYSATEYDRAQQVDLSYSRPWKNFLAGAELLSGKDSFGESYSRLAAFIRF